MPHRLPRFKRTAAVAPIQITPRDREILRLVRRHRFLRSSHISALLADQSQHVLRRLQALYHHGYLERPRVQLEYFHSGGSRHIVYGLGSKGAKLLGEEFRWSAKNRAVGRLFLEHALLVSDIMVTLELACRRAEAVRLVAEHELTGNGGKPLQWRVDLEGRSIGVVPDRTFALEYPGPNHSLERAIFFLEADRGTMPVVRKNLLQTSFYRKLLAYLATWTQGIHRTRLDFPRFRVLTVTTSVARVNSLVQACSKLKQGHGLFLFADKSVLDQPGLLTEAVWRNGRPDESGRLLA